MPCPVRFLPFRRAGLSFSCGTSRDSPSPDFRAVAWSLTAWPLAAAVFPAGALPPTAGLLPRAGTAGKIPSFPLARGRPFPGIALPDITALFSLARGPHLPRACIRLRRSAVRPQRA